MSPPGHTSPYTTNYYKEISYIVYIEKEPGTPGGYAPRSSLVEALALDEVVIAGIVFVFG